MTIIMTIIFLDLNRIWQYFKNTTQPDNVPNATMDQSIDNLEDKDEMENNGEPTDKIIIIQNEVIVPPINKSSRIEDHLYYPASPERKGKKQVERLPYAITLKKYRDMLDEKKKNKEKLEQQKEERKRRREKDKIEKTKKPTCLCSMCKAIIRTKKNCNM